MPLTIWFICNRHVRIVAVLHNETHLRFSALESAMHGDAMRGIIHG